MERKQRKKVHVESSIGVEHGGPINNGSCLSHEAVCRDKSWRGVTVRERKVLLTHKY